MLEPVLVAAQDLASGAVTVTNRYDFLSLSHLALSWNVEVNGEVVQSGSLELPQIQPGESRQLTVPYALPTVPAGAEVFLNLSFRLAASTIWAAAGHEVAWAQFKLPATEGRTIKPASWPLVCDEDAAELRISGHDFALRFDKSHGRLEAWHYQGLALLEQGPRLNFWRAPIDNDMHLAEKWREFGLHRLQERLLAFSWRQAGEKVEVCARVRLAPPILSWGYVCELTYTVHGSGDVLLEVKGEPEGELPPSLPRIGLALVLPEALDQVSWFGRGPGESYRDSKLANRFGLYSSSVAQLHTPYAYPQENGNRTDVSWVALNDLRGLGLFVEGTPSLNFSAHNYSQADLEQAKHTVDLSRRRQVFLNLDDQHHGLGSNSCGPGPLPQYELLPEKFSFKLRLKGFSAAALSPQALCGLAVD